MDETEADKVDAEEDKVEDMEVCEDNLPDDKADKKQADIPTKVCFLQLYIVKQVSLKSEQRYDFSDFVFLLLQQTKEDGCDEVIEKEEELPMEEEAPKEEDNNKKVNNRAEELPMSTVHTNRKSLFS